MLSGNDPLAAPPSFTARRSAASNLPNFELPPPPLSSLPQKFQPYVSIATSQSTPVSASLASVGSLLTPPSTLQDSLSPLSSGGVTSGSSTASGQAVPPYTPTGYWNPGQSNYTYPSGNTPQGLYQGSRGVFSPGSLNSIMRSTSTQPSDVLPAPPAYDLNQLPPFPTSLSMSAPASLPTLGQPQSLTSSYFNGPPAQPSPGTQHSNHAQDSYSQQRPPPNSSYYGHSHSHSYGSRPSSHQVSPAMGTAMSMSQMSGAGADPMQATSTHSPHAYSRPFNSYSLPAMNSSLNAPMMSGMHHQSNSLSMVGGMSNGMMTGFNTAGPAGSMSHMYGMPHNSHQQNHANDRPFKCDQCVQSFNRNHDLKRHKRIHLAVKPYPCNWCDKSFSRKDALKRHILVKGCGKTQPNDGADSDKNDDSNSPSKSDPSDASPLSPPLTNGSNRPLS